MFEKPKEKITSAQDPWSDDVLNRSRIASFLTNILKQSNNGFVLNIDAGWGTGKTFFLKRWRQSICDKHITAYFNAWDSDHSNDPLISFVSEIGDQITKAKSGNQFKTNVSNWMKKAGSISVSSVPLLIRAALRKTLGDEGLNEVKDLLGSELEEELIKEVDKATSAAIKEHQHKKKSIQGFKDLLVKIIDDIQEEDQEKKKLFIFIDELDRCRPTFSINLLEHIKHLFDIDGIVFIVSTDTRQLSHSIRAVYGSEFDSVGYLRRFFDQTFRLPPPSSDQFAKLLIAEYPFPARPSPGGILGFEDKAEVFAFFSKIFGLSLRDQERVHLRVRAAIANPQTPQNVHYQYLYMLSMIDLIHPMEYQNFLAGMINRHTLYELSIEKRIAQHPDREQLKSSDIYIIGQTYFDKTDNEIMLRKYIEVLDRERGQSNAMKGELCLHILQNYRDFKRHDQLIELAGHLS